MYMIYSSLLSCSLVLDTAGGEKVFWGLSATMILSAAVVVLLLLLVYLLVQNRKKDNLLYAQEEKEQTRMQRYSTTIKNMPVLYMRIELVKDGRGKVVDTIVREVNKFFSDKFLRPERCYGKRGSELFPRSTPVFLENINTALKRMRPVTFIYYFDHLDRYFNIVAIPSADRLHAETYCMDCTELHRAQEQLRDTNGKLSTVLDVVNIIPWKLDLKSNEFYIDLRHNSTIEESKRRERKMPFKKSYFFASISEDDKERIEKTFDDLVEGRINVAKEEYRTADRSRGRGKVDWVSIQAVAESGDENGKPAGLIGAVQIITDRKNMELELIKAKDEAEESNRMKTEFLTNISHEIRTPLNAIVGFSQLLSLSGKSDEERQKFSKYIEDNTELLLQLVNDALDLSKIEAGTMDFVYTDFDLNALMDELCNSMQAKLHTDRKVILTCNKGLPGCFINSERDRLTQLVVNMVSNAIKFTLEGSITFGYILRDGNVLYFYVTDTGCGIPEEKQENIFDRFVKLSSFAQGTGLGLSICKSIVMKMGGDIGVTSTEGKGSNFWFTIPYKVADPENKEDK